MALPALLIIITILGLVTCFIHYPDMVKVPAIITFIDTSRNSIEAEVELPPDSRFKLKAGQRLILYSEEYDLANPRLIEGKLEDVSYYRNIHKLKIVIYLLNKLSGDPHQEVLLAAGSRIGALIVIKDVSLLQRLFDNYSNKIKQ
jgi:hypothetical protein